MSKLRLKRHIKTRLYSAAGGYSAVKTTPCAAGADLPYKVFVPAAAYASPNTPAKLMIWFDGSGSRGVNGGANDPLKLTNQGGLGLNGVIPNVSTFPWFVMHFMFPGGPDIVTRYGRTAFYTALLDVLNTYNIDRNHIHIGGYSFGANQAWSTVLRWPKTFASLSLFDGFPVAFSLKNGTDTGAGAFYPDLLDPTLYPTSAGSWGVAALDPTYTPQARAAWCASVGDIPINYQHGARDTGTPTGPLANGASGADFVVRSNDPVANPNLNDGVTLGWSASLVANGQTGLTAYSGTTVSPPTVNTALKRVCVSYTDVDHAGLNSASNSPWAITNQWWAWMLARTGRKEY